MPALPAVGTTNSLAPASAARVTAAASPRALNDPVGFVASSLTQSWSNPWRAALTQRNRLFTVAQRQPAVIAPHRPTPPAELRLGFRQGECLVADKVGRPAHLADAGKAGGLTRAHGIAC